MNRAALQDSGAVGFTYGNTSQASLDAAARVLNVPPSVTIIDASPITPAALAQAFPGAKIGDLRAERLAARAAGVLGAYAEAARSEELRVLLAGVAKARAQVEAAAPAVLRDDSSSYSSAHIKATVNRVRNVLADLAYEDWAFRCGDRGGMVYIVASFDAPCNVAGGAVRPQLTRRWLIRPEASEAEIAQTVFKCVLTALEHEAREKFAYRGRAIFGPHNELAVLWDCAEEVV